MNICTATCAVTGFPEAMAFDLADSKNSSWLLCHLISRYSVPYLVIADGHNHFRRDFKALAEQFSIHTKVISSYRPQENVDEGINKLVVDHFEGLYMRMDEEIIYSSE